MYKKNPNSLLLLVGEGELKQKIGEKVKKLGLDKCVIFTGVRSDIPDILQAMDVFVFSSHYEGLPVILVEAQAAGLPCIVSNNITKQIKITDSIQFVDLKKPASFWGDTIIKLAKEHIRKDTSQEIVNAGFDIKQIAKEIQKWYELKVVQN